MTQISISEAAKLVGRNRKTLYRAIKEGRLSATQNATGGATGRYCRADKGFRRFSCGMPQWRDRGNATRRDTKCHRCHSLSKGKNRCLRG